MDLTKSPRLPAILLAASRVSLLLRFQRNVETLWNRWDENQNVGKLFLALISSVRSRGVSKSWRIRRMKRRRKQKGKQWGKERTRQRQRATYTRRWITHDCLAWNYSISPPLARTTDYPLPCSLRFHSIMHPASPTSHPPPPLLLLFFLRAWPRSDDVFSCETRRRTTTRDETRRAGNSIVPPRYPPLLLCPSSPNLDWRVCFFEKFARRGGGGGNVIVDLPLCWSKWKPRWTKSGEFASIRSKSLRFLSSSYRTADDRSLFEIQSVGQDDREFMNEPVTQWSTYFLEIAFVARLKFWHSSANAKCARAKGPRITM